MDIFFNSKIQEKDYQIVLTCLSNHIPKIYDESINLENEITINKNELSFGIFDKPTESGKMDNSHFSNEIEQRVKNINNDIDLNQKNNQNINNSTQEILKQRQITLPLLIPDNTDYCITGLYNLETFFRIIPALIEIMFYYTEYFIIFLKVQST